MILNGQNASYEIIQVLPESDGNLYYRGRRLKAEGGRLREGESCLFTGVALGEGILSMVSEWQENPAFVDFEDYLIRDDRIFLVFCDISGVPLTDALENRNVLQRFLVGQQVMERFLIQELPLDLRWELALKGDVYVAFSETGETAVSFFYRLESAAEYDGIGTSDGAKSLLSFLELLLSEESCRTHAEVQAFFDRDRGSEDENLLSVYKDYLMLLPVLSQEPSDPEQPGSQTLPERITGLWKAWSKKLFAALKIGMGLLTICAALILLPQVWQEKIKPVVDGAALWKSVYVDGNTLAQEETPSQPEESSGVLEDDGRRTIHWDNGQVRYQGGMQDDKYEGTGTLYYSSGGMEYQGAFAFGKREGSGISYRENGQILYEGGFHNDKYEGNGCLYEEEYGTLLYEGGFKSGRYSGEGILYQPLSEFPRYVGSFRLGHFDGKGIEYDENGCMKYEGDFLLGVYHGNGCMYDPEYGTILFEGAFRNGMPVLPEEMAEEAQTEEMLEGLQEETQTEELTEGESDGGLKGSDGGLKGSDEELKESDGKTEAAEGKKGGAEQMAENVNGNPEGMTEGKTVAQEEETETEPPSLSPVIGPVYPHKKQ